MGSDEEILRAVREANRWLRILALPVLREKLTGALAKPEMKRVYEMSDGRQMREVAAAAKVGHTTVGRYWHEWASQGLLEPTDVPGRFRKIVDLREIGLED